MDMWKDLTVDILSSVLNAAELSAVTRDRDQLSVDPVPGILRDVATSIRSRIAGGGRTTLKGGDMSIPEELMSDAGALIRYRILSRFALSMTEERKAEWAHANEVLRELSSGSYIIADDASGKTPRPHYSGRPQRWRLPQGGGIM